MAYQPEIEKWVMEERKLLGQRIKQARTDADLTQEEFGNMIGLSNAAVSAIELGKTSVALEDLIVYARRLNKPLIFFLPKQPDIDVEEQVLLEGLRRLSQGERDAMLAALRFTHEQRRKRGEGADREGEGNGLAS